jgi:predicted nucleotidyltransferase component of viral defense system
MVVAGFQDSIVNKVERLLDLMGEVGRHPKLKGKLCMYGGTAINIFMLNVPRLSVDIDLAYVGELDREKMLAERPIIEEAIEEVVAFAGYTASGSSKDHAGRTFHLRYKGDWGADQIKIDLTYLNRVPLIQPVELSSFIRPSLSVLTFDEAELIGGKVKALYDRVAVRDLYDIANLKTYLDRKSEEQPRSITLAHKVILHYASISSHFPFPLEKRVTDSFSNRGSELVSYLYPMLREERPSLASLVEQAEKFVHDYVLPVDDADKEYLSRLALADYQPQILFAGYPDVATAAEKSPAAQWKVQNLKKLLQKESAV